MDCVQYQFFSIGVFFFHFSLSIFVHFQFFYLILLSLSARTFSESFTLYLSTLVRLVSFVSLIMSSLSSVVCLDEMHMYLCLNLYNSRCVRLCELV